MSLDNPLPYLIELLFPQRLWRLQGKKPSQNEEKKEDNKKIQTEKHSVQVPTPCIMYPQKLKKGKLEKQFVKFLDIFKKLHINIPFMDALENMLSYVKFMKNIFSNKKKFGEYGTISLTEECSAILQKELPPKFQDPGSFAIPFSIRNSLSSKAHCYLRESINLMPLSMFKRLNLGEAIPTTIMLQMADWSYKHPRGVIENVLVKVDKFLFLADFAILDMEEDDKVPIIISRPFLATRKAQINVQEGELKLRVQGDEVTFHVFQAMKHPDDDTNDDILKSSHEERMHGNLVNCTDMISAVKKEKDKDIKKETKGVDGVGDSILQPP